MKPDFIRMVDELFTEYNKENEEYISSLEHALSLCISIIKSDDNQYSDLLKYVDCDFQSEETDDGFTIDFSYCQSSDNASIRILEVLEETSSTVQELNQIRKILVKYKK